MSDLDLIGLLKSATTQGPAASDDTALVATGTVITVDAGGRRARVSLRGGDVWLPAVAGRYQVNATARVLLDPTAGRPVLILGTVSPRPPALLGKVVSGPTAGNLTVTVDGVTYTIPCPMGAYTVGSSAWVLTDDWGVPVIVIGPSSDVAPTGGTPAPALPAAVVTATVTISPQQSGTWRSSYGKWDVWGGSLGGGLPAVYQGNAYGSGPLTGLACYGDQVLNLGAISITRITLNVSRNGSGSGPVALTVQGSPNGTRPAGAPTSSGTTASTGAVALNGSGSVDLPSDVRENFRTGAVKALAAVGGSYAGFGGTATPGSFTLTIQYTRNA